MCIDCADEIVDFILDFVLAGTHLDIAIRLCRDAVVQAALNDRVGEEALNEALYLSDAVSTIGEHLVVLQAYAEPTYMAMLQARQVSAEAGP